jgi:hypothetical protein
MAMSKKRSNVSQFTKREPNSTRPTTGTPLRTTPRQLNMNEILAQFDEDWDRRTLMLLKARQS